MRYFCCAIFDAEGRMAISSFIVAADDHRARLLARSELARTHRATHAELTENGRVIAVERP